MTSNNNTKPPYIIAVGGQSGSGKTSLAQLLKDKIDSENNALIAMDNFYKPLNEEEKKCALRNEFDFDNPNALDLDLVYELLYDIKVNNCKTIKVPKYSFVEHNRIPNEYIVINNPHIIILEGLYALYDDRILDLIDLKIYVDADLDICLARRITRDMLHRGRDLEGCLKQWIKFVKPASEVFIRPTMKKADVIIPNFASKSDKGVKVLISHLKNKLMERDVEDSQISSEKTNENTVESSNSSSDLEEDIIEALDANRKNSLGQSSKEHIICSNCEHKLPLVTKLGNYQLDTPEDSE
ncbi:uncharacterized protein HGUI_01501 [Hanseniaspora guilliermondii]|uniref:Uridine kinase n=1 Tax=Hanseniaspora guilliermondii TaxID=56406 RepID=A0A1L0CKD6_9ASCO|nr:uncharacterized protein HGUI_01501 [Hanseniaspora guilliermondii]